MPMTQEEAQDFRDSALLLSAPELKGMLGGDEDEDKIINEILSAGKQVEAPGLPEVEEEELAEDEEEEEEEEESEEEEAPAPAPQPQPQDDPTPTPAPAADPDFVAPALDLSHLNTELDAGLATIDAKRAEAMQKMMDGEITAADYAKIDAQTLRERDAMRETLADTKAWFTTVHNFQVQQAQAGGVNYFTDNEKFAAWDDWIKRIASKGIPQGASDTWVLEQAHKKVMAEFDITPPAANPAQNGTKNVADGKKVAPKTARTPNLSAIPPTLGGLPAAAPASGGDGGEFAHLDKLSGLAYEQAIARMSPEQRDRWSRQ